MSDDRVLDKIRKLLAMTGGGSTEAEAQVALTKAHGLMAEYHLTEADLAHEPQDDYSKVDGAPCDRFPSFVGKKAYTWESGLAQFVSKFVGVPYYLESSISLARKRGRVLTKGPNNDQCWEGKAYTFYGLAEDAALASDLYDELHQVILTMALLRWGGAYKGEGGVYCEGFVQGLGTKLKETLNLESQQAKTSTALVLAARREDLVNYKQDKAKDWLTNVIGLKLSTGQRRTGARGSNYARQEGRADGCNTNVSAARSRKLN